MCWFGLRVTSRRSGSSNTASSRLPDPNHVVTFSPALISLPLSTMSRVAVRRKWYTALETRKNSSTAQGISSGRSRRRASWSGLAIR